MAEFDADGEVSRAEVARFLREFANELDHGDVSGRQTEVISEDQEERHIDERSEGVSGDRTDRFSDDRPDLTGTEMENAERITLIVGGDSATVTVPEMVEFDIEIDSRSPLLSANVHQEIDMKLSWTVDNPDEVDEKRMDVE